MISDGLIHEEAWFETLITPIKVAEADYPRMLAEGLYEYWRPAIPPDAETITVRYFTPDDNLLWLDAIPIVRDGKKGDKGDDGKRGGQYWGQSKPSYPVSGDTYLDTTEMVLKEYYGTSWVSVPYTMSERYTVAINDIIASAASSQELMKIANAWVANLVAGTILANQLMAKQLTVQDGGCIQSQNYRAGASGWRIGSDGRAEFEDGVFRGKVNATSGVFENVIVKSSCIIEGVAVVNNTPFTPGGSVTASLDPYDGSIYSFSGKNITSITYQGTGTFRLNFKTPLQIKYTTQSGQKYIDLFCVGSGYLYERGCMTTLIPTVNWSRNSVNGSFAETNGRVAVTYVDIIFYQAGLSGTKTNPDSMHLFLFYTEV